MSLFHLRGDEFRCKGRCSWVRWGVESLPTHDFWFFFSFCFFCSFSGQHWGWVRAYGGGRSHVQGVPHPPQKPEDPGRGRGDHPPESRHQARDLVGSDHQLLDRRSTLARPARRRRGSSPVSVLRLFFFLRFFFFRGGAMFWYVVGAWHWRCWWKRIPKRLAFRNWVLNVICLNVSFEGFFIWGLNVIVWGF